MLKTVDQFNIPSVHAKSKTEIYSTN